MRTNFIAYLITAIVFFGMDFLWLTLSFETVYKARLGDLFLDKPNFPVAGLFYLMYVAGIVAFVVAPALTADSWLRALGFGVLFGLIAYGTYDMTNLATLKGWSPVASAIDMAWGGVATGVAATAGFFLTRWIG